MSLLLRVLRKKAGLTQAELAEQLGLRQGQIGKLEHPDRRLSMDWIERLAPHLGLTPAEMAAMEAAGDADRVDELEDHLSAPMRSWRPEQRARFVEEAKRHRSREGMYVGADKRVLRAGEVEDDIPVLSLARGGVAQPMYLEDGPIDWAPRPDYLRRVRDAFAAYMVGESMLPRYRPGQLLFLNPHRPPKSGDGVVVVLTDDAVLIKEWVRQDHGDVVLREYQPEMKEFTVPAANVRVVHTVVGLQEA